MKYTKKFLHINLVNSQLSELFLKNKLLINMRKIFLISLVIVVSNTFSSCKTILDKDTYIEAFKLSVTNSCISEGMDNKTYDDIVFQNDASFSYDALAGPDNYKIDSVGRSEGKKIPRTPIEDLGKKKLIHSHCLKFYKSKELDKIAKDWWRKNKL